MSWWVDPAARQLRHDQRPEVINVGCDRAAAGVGEQALDAEVEWGLLGDGTLTRGTGNTRRGGRAWGRP